MTGRKCRRIERLLALAAGGDLASRHARSWEVEKHLRICARCRASAEALAATVDTLHGLPALKLSAEEGAELRRGVWGRIEQDRARASVTRMPDGRRAAWQAAGWAGAALLALVLLLPWRAARDDSPARIAAPASSPPGATPASALAPQPPTAAAPTPQRAPRLAGRRTQRRSRPAHDSTPTERVRIELSTPDPDVRIVWLVGPAGEPLPPLSDDFETSDTTSTIKENPE